MADAQPKVLFLARSLGYGGAERQLIELARALRGRGFEVTVACFYEPGALGEELVSSGVSLVSLGKRGRWDLLGFMSSLIDVVSRTAPDILHSYLVEPNLLGALVKPRFPRLRIVWGVRASNMDFARYGVVGRATFAATIALSRVPDLIIANSKAGADYHVGRGYPAASFVVVPNGIDTRRFQPNADARREVRRELGFADDTLVIGQVGRIDVMKDHPTFLRAAALFAAANESARFLCVGSGEQLYEREMRSLAEGLGLGGRVSWIPARNDPERLYNACDLMTSTSAFGEGFPNVIAEAMACGVPCVVTDVGDSSVVVGDAGIVVPPGRPELVERAWHELTPRRSESLRSLCRNQIADNFNIDFLADRTIAAFHRALAA